LVVVIVKECHATVLPWGMGIFRPENVRASSDDDHVVT
jgi:hypothetical protein